MKEREMLLIDPLLVTLSLAKAMTSSSKHQLDKNFPFYMPPWKF